MSGIKEHERLRITKHIEVENHVTKGNFPVHWHDFFEIEIIISGRGKYTVNDVAYDISEKNVFFLTHTDFHRIDVDGEAEMINISFDREAVGEEDIVRLLFNKIDRAYFFAADEYCRLVSAAELLRYECNGNGDGQRLLLLYIIGRLLRKNPTVGDGPSFDGIHGIKKAIIYIELHFKERVTLAELAAEAGYHPTYFSELFKRTTGESYIENLTRLRVGNARMMLANGFSVSDACFLSGFGSLSGFAAAFRKTCNMSPSDYKKLYSSKNR